MKVDVSEMEELHIAAGHHCSEEYPHSVFAAVEGDWQKDELVKREDAVKQQIEMLNQIDEQIRKAIKTTDRDVPYFVYDQIKKHRHRLKSQLDTEQKNAEGDF